MPKFVYHIIEACAVSGLGRTRLYEEIACGRLDARKLGSKTVITAESLRKYTESLPPARINVKPRWPAQEGAGSGDKLGNSTAARQLAPENVGLKAEAFSSLARASAKTEAR
jgi:hypothetical protein